MRESISQFMWGFQPHFRGGLESSSRDVFRQIGFGLGPRAYLVGFSDDPAKEWAICFEPETDPLASVDITEVAALAEEKYEAHADSHMLITSRRHQERFHQGLRDKMRAESLKEVLEAHPLGASQYFFVGASGMVDGYEVHPMIGVPRARWDSKPALTRVKVDRYPITPSFQHAVMSELLSRASKDLGRQDPPENYILSWLDASEMIRQAARSFVQSISLLAGFRFPSELTVALDEVSAQPYEGRASSGGFILADEASSSTEILLRFEESIDLAQTRGLRKALEMSGEIYKLLCDGESVLGLAKRTANYDESSETVFNFNIVSRNTWELSHAGVALLRVANTRPVLPSPQLETEHFKDIVGRIFPECNGTDVDRLWELAEACARAKHGTMLVIHRKAAEESERMRPQSQRVAPVQLSLDAVDAVTRIDGAVLVDVEGTCHAVGVILDGRATGTGDVTRGARFNSAIRYEEAQRGDCLVVVISEDGMINLQPNLRRRIKRKVLQDAVDSLVGEGSEADPDYEVFFRHWHHLESLAFYLSEEQCDRINRARAKLEEHRAATSQIQIGWSPFAPRLEMDPSYLYD